MGEGGERAQDEFGADAAFAALNQTPQGRTDIEVAGEGGILEVEAPLLALQDGHERRVRHTAQGYAWH